MKGLKDLQPISPSKNLSDKLVAWKANIFEYRKIS